MNAETDWLKDHQHGRTLISEGIEEVISVAYRLRGVGMDRLADELMSAIDAIYLGSKMTGNAITDMLNRDIQRNYQTIGGIFSALLDRAEGSGNE